MTILSGDPPIKDYHNPKFESFSNALVHIMKASIYCIATRFLADKLTIWVAFLLMFLYFAFSCMIKNRIYFHSNRGFGPGWKQTLCEDISLALQYALASVGGAWLIQWLVQ